MNTSIVSLSTTVVQYQHPDFLLSAITTFIHGTPMGHMDT